MKVSAILSTALCLGAAQLVGAEKITSTLTTTITKTLIRVNAVTPSATPPASSSVAVIPTSSPVSSTFVPTSSPSAPTSSAGPSHTPNAAGTIGDNSLPVALFAGSVALALAGAL